MSGPSRRSAAALVYDTNAADGAPRVVAKGYGLVAETIVQRAKEAGVYVHAAPEMVSLLMQVDLDARIPPQLYQAVAELLAWLHRLETGEAAADEAPAALAGHAAGAAGPPAVVVPAEATGAGDPADAPASPVTTSASRESAD